MFDFLRSADAKARSGAAVWLEMAEKIYDYRRDLLTPAQLAKLQAARDALKALVKAKAKADVIKASIEKLESVMKETGGKLYPASSIVENVEFFLVAAIVILGLRAYFVQPFKIPTNSMWPSYFGMKSACYSDPQTAPGLAEQAFRLLAFGATRRTASAPAAGELEIPFRATQDGQLTVEYRRMQGRKWLVIPAEVREYTFYVGGEPVSFRVPADFSEVDSMVTEALFRNSPDLRPYRDEFRATGHARLKTGRRFEKGDTVFSFDVLTGDQLFVDRFSYHFFDPQVGEGFVFRTRNIELLGQDQYYIKRLAGVPGDVMEIRAPVLFRNGSPITGAEAFDLNAKRTGLYRGYANGVKSPPWLGLLGKGETLQVPENSFLALGDNSHNSLDGRFWGYVPAKDAMGRPLFIYYPFSKRWGPAR